MAFNLIDYSDSGRYYDSKSLTFYVTCERPCSILNVDNSVTIEILN